VGLAISIWLIAGTCEGDVGPGNMIVEIVRHRPHEAKTVGNVRRVFQQLAQDNSGLSSLNSLERTPNLR
jgi:hypothetical protein